jgi:uncharacterized SAM-binding protein YcdF (DUF218 family)
VIAGFTALPLILIGPSRTAASEVILHLAIAPRSDADRYVAELYRQKLAGRIVCISTQISRGIYPADYTRQHLIDSGIPPEDVQTLRLPTAACTAENLPLITQYVKDQGWRSALLVVRPLGSRFSRRLMERYFSREGITVTLTYSPNDSAELTDGWWRSHWKAQQMVEAAASTILDSLYPECW